VRYRCLARAFTAAPLDPDPRTCANATSTELQTLRLPSRRIVVRPPLQSSLS
jgi:hypothetical protein